METKLNRARYCLAIKKLELNVIRKVRLICVSLRLTLVQLRSLIWKDKWQHKISSPFFASDKFQLNRGF